MEEVGSGLSFWGPRNRLQYTFERIAVESPIRKTKISTKTAVTAKVVLFTFTSSSSLLLVVVVLSALLNSSNELEHGESAVGENFAQTSLMLML